MISADCPTPPGGVGARLPALILHEACQTVGGIVALADLLGVPQLLVDRWLGGEDEVPEAIYQACIDIVLTHDGGSPR